MSCKWHDTTWHQKTQKTWTYENFEKIIKKSGVAGTRTHDKDSVPLWHLMLYHCATGLTQWKMVKMKIIYHVEGILCCMVLCRHVWCCVVSCQLDSLLCKKHYYEQSFFRNFTVISSGL